MGKFVSWFLSLEGRAKRPDYSFDRFVKNSEDLEKSADCLGKEAEKKEAELDKKKSDLEKKPVDKPEPEDEEPFKDDEAWEKIKNFARTMGKPDSKEPSEKDSKSAHGSPKRRSTGAGRP